MADEQQKAKARAARFANDAKKPPPAPPKKTFAHPGGKMTTNKEEALRKYLARKGDSLNAAQKQALEDLQRKGLAPPTPPKPAEDRTDKLFVGNLPYKLDDQRLGALFASRYHVIGSKIVLDRQTNRGRGFGFVTFGSSEDAADLISRLLVNDPNRRLGMQRKGIRDLKEHSWFKDIDFIKLARKKLTPPYKPQIAENIDTSYFDRYDDAEDSSAVPVTVGTWDDCF